MNLSKCDPHPLPKYLHCVVSEFREPPRHAKERLYNDVIGLLRDQGVAFRSTHVDSVGKRVVGTLTDLFWYLSPFHERLTERGHRVPQLFCSLLGYRDWQAQNQKKPQVQNF